MAGASMGTSSGGRLGKRASRKSCMRARPGLKLYGALSRWHRWMSGCVAARPTFPYEAERVKPILPKSEAASEGASRSCLRASRSERSTDCTRFSVGWKTTSPSEAARDMSQWTPSSTLEDACNFRFFGARPKRTASWTTASAC
eukprot:scaffold140808_cov142-Phaeocystis_antarctica.AAC.1